MRKRDSRLLFTINLSSYRGKQHKIPSGFICMCVCDVFVPIRRKQEHILAIFECKLCKLDVKKERKRNIQQLLSPKSNKENALYSESLFFFFLFLIVI